MPAKYEAIRDKMVAKGMPLAQAKTHAAKIFNATRKKGEAPVTGPEPSEKRVGVQKKK